MHAQTPPPKHVAIVMDGNGRWAKANGLEKIEGHKKGAEAAKALIPRAKELGITTLTLFAFSKENWGRDPHEVQGLLELISRIIQDSKQELERLKTRVRVIGAVEDFPDNIAQKIYDVEQMNIDYAELTVVFALSYGARQDIVRAVQEISAKVRNNELLEANIDEALVAGHLSTKGLTEPDLLIRSSGELRLSNFLLWEMAYTELYFTPCLWPDFTPDHLSAAVDSYCTRLRCYGKSRHD